MALSIFNDPFFTEYRTPLDQFGNILGSTLDTGLGNMNRMTRMPLRVTETDDKFKVLAEIPGIASKKDINIKLDQGVLSIEAEKRKEKVQDTEILHREEVQYGKLIRSIRIPEYVVVNNPRAVLENGVLCICLDKEPQMKNQALHIPIEEA